MTAPDDQDCATCRFWRNAEAEELRLRGAIVFTDQDDDGGGLGFCQRRAPIATGGMMSNPSTIWAVTGEADWCGEFEESPAIAAGDALLVEPKCATCQDGMEPPPSPKTVTADGRCPDCGEYTIPF